MNSCSPRMVTAAWPLVSASGGLLSGGGFDHLGVDRLFGRGGGGGLDGRRFGGGLFGWGQVILEFGSVFGTQQTLGEKSNGGFKAHFESSMHHVSAEYEQALADLLKAEREEQEAHDNWMLACTGQNVTPEADAPLALVASYAEYLNARLNVAARIYAEAAHRRRLASETAQSLAPWVEPAPA